MSHSPCPRTSSLGAQGLEAWLRSKQPHHQRARRAGCIAARVGLSLVRVRLRPGPPSRNCSSRGRLDACAWRDAPAAARATASQLQGSIASLPPALMSSVQPLTLLPLIRSTGQPPPRPPPYAQAHTDHVHARTPADKNRSSGASPPWSSGTVKQLRNVFLYRPAQLDAGAACAVDAG